MKQKEVLVFQGMTITDYKMQMITGMDDAYCVDFDTEQAGSFWISISKTEGEWKPHETNHFGIKNKGNGRSGKCRCNQPLDSLNRCDWLTDCKEELWNLLKDHPSIRMKRLFLET